MTTFDPNPIVIVVGALSTLIAAVGALLGGRSAYLGRRAASLEAELTAERVEQARENDRWRQKETDWTLQRTALEARLEVSRDETDVARAKQEEIRRDMQAEIDRIVGARRADRLQHEAEMQARVHELGGQP